MYAWTTNGGKLNSTDKQSAQIDTTGVAAGSYTANATITDPKINRHLDAGSHSFMAPGSHQAGDVLGELHREGEADESAAGQLLGQPEHGAGW